MEKIKIQDERVLSIRSKIQSDAYEKFTWVLAIAIIIQQIFLDAPFSQYAAEFFILVIAILYTSIRQYQEDATTWHPKSESKNKLLFNIVISGLGSVIFLTYFSGISDTEWLAFYFVIFVILYAIIQSIAIAIINKKREIIENKLDEDEMGE